MPGPAPKDPSVRARRNKTSTKATLRADHAIVAPELPGEGWHAMTVAWWLDIWASPMAPEFDSSDRHGLYQLASLVEDFWRAENAAQRRELAGEIRLQSQRFGLSPLDRRRLQWEIERTEEAQERGRARRTGEATKPATRSRRKPDPRATLYAV